MLPIKKRNRSASGGNPRPKKQVAYEKGPIPYAVSQPKRFWRIAKGLPSDQYWAKRYWRRRITGRGDYSFSSGRTTGQNWGGYLGSKAGEYLGGAAQQLFGSITGLGDYKVRKNIFASGRLPEIVNNPAGGGIVFRFEEYLGDIITGAASTFNITSYLINAANTRTFPVLSQLAANFEQYDMEGLIFQFRSTSGDALTSTNTALGSVMMATQYDVSDAIFASKTEMLNYEYSTSAKPSENVGHMVECDPRQTTISELFCLTGAQPSNTDARLYHLGRFSIATFGFQGTNVNIGELHVTYQARLLKPKLFSSLGNFNGYMLKFYDNTANNTLAIYTNALPLGVATFQSLPNNFDSIGVVVTGSTIIFPRTTSKLFYRIELAWTAATAAVIATPAFGGSGGLTVISSGTSPNDGLSSQRLIALLGIQINGDSTSPVLTLSTSGTLPLWTSGTSSSLTIRIMQVTGDSSIAAL